MIDNTDEINKGKIPVLEEFYSIQGEGYNTGKPAYFIRTGGCDLACKWCDSKESWQPEDHQYVRFLDIINRLNQTPADTIIVTGGEPLMYNFDEFCRLAKNKGIVTMIETCGAHPFSGIWDWICLSPKNQKPPKNEYYNIANELKVIICSEKDLLWAEECASKVNKTCELYLQPEWSNFEHTGKIVVDYVKRNVKWKVSIQSHKFLRIP